MTQFEAHNDGQTTLLRANGELTIEHASEFREAVWSAINSCASVTVDLSGVTMADLACMQLLCSAFISSYAKRTSFVVRGLSAAVIKSVERGGLRRFPDYGEECCWLSGGYHG